MRSQPNEREAKEPRLGEWGRPVAQALGVSLALATLAFIGLAILYTTAVVPSIGLVPAQ